MGFLHPYSGVVAMSDGLEREFSELRGELREWRRHMDDDMQELKRDVKHLNTVWAKVAGAASFVTASVAYGVQWVLKKGDV
jgi:hypothetical protein